MRHFWKIILIPITVIFVLILPLFSGCIYKNPNVDKTEEVSSEEVSNEDNNNNKFPEIQIIGKETFNENNSNISADIDFKDDEPEIIYRYNQGYLYEAIVNTILINKGLSGYGNITLKVNGIEGKPKQTYFEHDEEKTISFSIRYKDKYPIVYNNVIVISKDPYVWIKLDNNKTIFLPIVFSGINRGPILR